jgi:hypothetical protein
MAARSNSKPKKKAAKPKAKPKRAAAKKRAPGTPDEPATMRIKRADVVVEIEERLVLDSIKES